MVRSVLRADLESTTMGNDRSATQPWNDESGSVSRRSFLAGTGALSLAMVPSWDTDTDLFTDDSFADSGEVHEALGDGAWELLTQLTRLKRFGGHQGEQRAATLLADTFETIGFDDVTEQPFEIQRWTRGDSDVTVTDPVEHTFERHAQPIALPYSPSGDVHAELVDVGHGTPDEIDDRDVEGKIAVASTDSPEDHRFVHRMETYGHLVEAGAAAFVFANHVEGQLAPTGALRFNEEAEIPGLGVSNEMGAWLTDYAEQGGSARIRVDASTETAESQNVYGTLGPDTNEEIVLLGHYDAHDITEGATDNAAGITTVVTAARLLADVDLSCRVRIAGVGSEEIGLIGSGVLADSLDTGTVRAVINADGAGHAPDLVANTQSSEALGDVVASVEETAEQSIGVEPAVSPYSDHWPFLEQGVPTVHLSSETEGRGRGWGHTRADTRDKVDQEALTDHARLTALMVRELTTTDPPRISDEELCTALHEEDLEPGMRATGIWPEVCD